MAFLRVRVVEHPCRWWASCSAHDCWRCKEGSPGGMLSEVMKRRAELADLAELAEVDGRYAWPWGRR